MQCATRKTNYFGFAVLRDTFWQTSLSLPDVGERNAGTSDLQRLGARCPAA